MVRATALETGQDIVPVDPFEDMSAVFVILVKIFQQYHEYLQISQFYLTILRLKPLPQQPNDSLGYILLKWSIHIDQILHSNPHHLIQQIPNQISLTPQHYPQQYPKPTLTQTLTQRLR